MKLKQSSVFSASSLCPLRPEKLALERLYKYLIAKCVSFQDAEVTKKTQRTQRLNASFMNISQNKVVSLRYVMKNSSGDVIENTMERPPIQYLHGAGKIIPALEIAVEGMTAGQKKAFSISDSGLRENLHFDLIIDEVREATPEEVQNGKPTCGPGCCC